jgi:hypothetical protein
MISAVGTNPSGGLTGIVASAYNYQHVGECGSALWGSGAPHRNGGDAMKKPLKPTSRRSGETTRRVNATAAAAAAVVTAALSAAVPGNAVAGADVRAGAPDVADRVVALRQLLAEKPTSVAGTTSWVDPVFAPGAPVAQWNKWKNG